MKKIKIKRQVFDNPTRVKIEASLDEIIIQNLDTFEGEQYDYINDVIIIDVNPYESTVIFETCRTIEDPVREYYVIPRKSLEAIYA